MAVSISGDGVVSGLNTTQSGNAAVPVNYLAGLGLAKFYESPPQTITAGGALTLVHGLGVVPKSVETILQNVTAEAWYSVGQLVFHAINGDDGTSVKGAAISPDSANLNIRFTSATTAYSVPNYTTGGRAALTNANWRVIFRAWG